MSYSISWLYNVSNNNKYIGGNCLRKSICPALRQIGHSVREIPNFNIKHNIDSDIVISTDLNIDPNSINNKCTKVIWDIDDPECPIKRKWDIIFTNSYHMVPIYKSIYDTKNVEWLTFAFDNILHKPSNEHKLKNIMQSDYKEWDCLYIGNGIESKSYNIILEPATRFNLAIFGSEWNKRNNVIYSKYLKGPAEFSLLYDYYSKSRIALNMHRESQRFYNKSFIMKDFEILGCGAMCISDWFKGCDEYFGDYMVTCKSSLETKSAIEYYLNNPDLCEETGKNARKFILDNHTYIHRAKELIEKLENML